VEHSVVFHTSGDQRTSSERNVSIRGDCRVAVEATPDRAIVVARMLDVLGNLLGPVIRRGQLRVNSGRCLEREEK